MAVPTATKPELIMHKVCPFAHRAWLALEESGIEWTMRETSLDDKPAWFTDTYRSALGADVTSDGKVPVLLDGDFVLAESAVVADYIAGKWAKGIAPATPQERARTQIFLEQQVSKIIKWWYATLSAADEATLASSKAEFLAAVAAVSTTYARTSGPYFAGDRLSLADILVWPWLARLPVLTHYHGITVPNEPAYAAYHRFVAAMSSRPAVKATQIPDEEYIKLYHKYVTKAPASK